MSNTDSGILYIPGALRFKSNTNKDLFVVKAKGSAFFYIFSIADGMYFTSCSHSVNHESMSDVINEHADRCISIPYITD